MKKIAILFAAAFAVSAWAQTYVKPYVKRDGTYVEGHMRSNPNSTRQDNYSTQGNVNPYTGKDGTESPYKPLPGYSHP